MSWKQNEEHLLIGQVVGSYRVVELIGRGRTTTVLKALHTVLGRPVAIKIFPDYHDLDPLFNERLVHEMRSFARFSLPNIVQIYDYGVEEQRVYLVLQYAEGGALKERLRQNQPLPLRKTLELAIQLAEGLRGAHAHGILHGSVEPASIFIHRYEQVLLSDFGLANLVPSRTCFGQVVMGMYALPQYMSPERAGGEYVDARSDMYSLGMVLFHCLTGRVPFDGDGPLEIVVQQMNEPLPVALLRQANVPELVEQIIVKMTAKFPAERYQTMAEVVDALQNSYRVLYDRSWGEYIL